MSKSGEGGASSRWREIFVAKGCRKGAGVSEKLKRLKSKWRVSMQYILMLHAAESGWAQLTEAQQREGMVAYLAYTEALKKAGVLRGVNRLRPSTTATLVRAAEGKSQVLNGPYVDPKEQMGGFYIIDVAHQEAA